MSFYAYILSSMELGPNRMSINPCFIGAYFLSQYLHFFDILSIDAQLCIISILLIKETINNGMD
jgi:hypothetical protein